MKPLRKCPLCGLEAHTQEDLELFQKCPTSKHGRGNRCKKCNSENSRKHHRTHREEILEKQKKYRETHPESERKRNRKYYETNREKILNHKNERNRELRRLVFNKLGNKCVRCGYTDPRALQIDHIHGGGSKEHRKYNGPQYIVMLDKLPLHKLKEKYQVLCANCNWIKRFENKEHG